MKKTTLKDLKFQFIEKSGNTKTGIMPVTYNSAATCPDSCIFKNNGCYASQGYYTRMNWDKVTAGIRGGSFKELLNKIKALPASTLWRAHIAGDIPANERGEVSEVYINKVSEANKGRRGYTYTHHDLNIKNNSKLFKKANNKNFIINVSCESEQQADTAVNVHKLPAVMVVKSTEQRKAWTTAGGNRVIICPAQSAGRSCVDCRLCADRPSPRLIIAFLAHGNAAKKINQILDNIYKSFIN